MTQYIDKSVVIAEIERIKKEECPTDSYEGRCKLLWFEQFLSFLDTLAVKEVDSNDAFIYRACDAYCKVCGHYAHKTPTHICRQDCDYFDNFKKYMKGGEE